MLSLLSLSFSLSFFLGLSWEDVGEAKIDEDEVGESHTGRFGLDLCERRRKL